MAVARFLKRRTLKTKSGAFCCSYSCFRMWTQWDQWERINSITGTQRADLLQLYNGQTIFDRLWPNYELCTACWSEMWLCLCFTLPQKLSSFSDISWVNSVTCKGTRSFTDTRQSLCGNSIDNVDRVAVIPNVYPLSPPPPQPEDLEPCDSQINLPQGYPIMCPTASEMPGKLLNQTRYLNSWRSY